MPELIIIFELLDKVVSLGVDVLIAGVREEGLSLRGAFRLLLIFWWVSVLSGTTTPTG